MITFIFIWCLLSTSGEVCKESQEFKTVAACEEFRSDMQKDLAWMVRTGECKRKDGV